MSTTDLSRRSVLRGSALAAVAGALGYLVARRSDAAKARTDTSVTDAYAAYGAPAAANAYGAPPTDKGSLLARLDQLPAGGGLVLADRGVVLTRDAEGTVRGFASLCTHQGCNVGSVKNGRIVCPCHGSLFDARTGAPVQGPATLALGAVPVVVRDGTVFTG